MSAAQPLTGSVSKFSELSADPAFMAEPVESQTRFLQQEYLPKRDKAFASASENEQRQYIQQVVLPEIQKLKPMQPPQPVQQSSSGAGIPLTTPFGVIPNSSHEADINTNIQAYGAGRLAKGASFGYIDPNMPAPEGAETAGNIAEFAGAALPFEAIENLGARALQGAGRWLLPRTTELARAAGVGQEWMRPALTAVSQLQGKELLPTALRMGTAGAAYEGAKSIPEKQLDIGQRAMNAAGGFAATAALPVAGAAAGKVLKGGVQATRNIFQGNNAPVGMAELQNALKRASKKQLHETFELLANTVRRIQTGEIDPALVDPNDYAALVQGMDYVGKAIKTGKAIKRPNFARGLARRVEGKAKIRAKKSGRTVAVEKPVEKEPEATLEIEPPKPKQEKQTLKGAIKEMVRQVEKDANLPEDAGASTAGQVEKKTNRKLTTAERDIHNNLRAIARTEAVDDARGIHQQFEVNPDRQLKYEAIKGQVSQEHQAIAEKLDEAMSQGKAIRVEYAAEEAGRSNEAAKVTNTGNVKVEVTDFTPLHWTLTSGDKAMIHGYNQRGHFVSYHLEPSTNGSQVLKAGKIIDRAFVGEYPNVYLGARRFLVKDVLGRGVRSADGPVKTSEAIAVAEQTAAIFKAIENNPAIPPEIKRILKKISTGKKATRAELLILQSKFKKPKDIELLQTFCKMMGL
jgi:hypothetical protein